ncbi:triacylglycerol lipase [Okeania sp. SIO2B9]|uniref:esterase/lipase family protein n=1 Tax=Okeania sp. SIO2B9 TaxID=2607782 RepID=UPI0025795A61|nr:alpha/beta hydrolase [Okeania sp. SIO2B9]
MSESRIIKISGCDDQNRTGDVIFVHGLDGHPRKTWHPQEKSDDDNFWPVWLGEDLPDMGIWSLKYEVSSSHWKGESMPLVDRATNILKLLDTYKIGDRPLFFITHSMGGLLVKQMLYRAVYLKNPKWKAIVDQTQGIVFFSTPHSGSNLANLIKYMGWILQTTVSIDELEAHHPRLRELTDVYRSSKKLSKIP